jgi:hypothetical protein
VGLGVELDVQMNVCVGRELVAVGGWLGSVVVRRGGLDDGYI